MSSGTFALGSALFRGPTPPYDSGKRSASPVRSTLAHPAADAKCHLEGLAVIEARITDARVVLVEIGFGDPTPDALGDVLARELEVDAAELGADLAMHGEGPLDLAQDVVEAPRLDSARRRVRVAVHRIAHPE